jgi:hypothetical protein
MPLFYIRAGYEFISSWRINFFLLPGGMRSARFLRLTESHISAVKTNESYFILEFQKLSKREVAAASQ